MREVREMEEQERGKLVITVRILHCAGVKDVTQWATELQKNHPDAEIRIVVEV